MLLQTESSCNKNVNLITPRIVQPKSKKLVFNKTLRTKGPQRCSKSIGKNILNRISE